MGVFTEEALGYIIQSCYPFRCVSKEEIKRYSFETDLMSLYNATKDHSPVGQIIYNSGIRKFKYRGCGNTGTFTINEEGAITAMSGNLNPKDMAKKLTWYFSMGMDPFELARRNFYAFEEAIVNMTNIPDSSKK